MNAMNDIADRHDTKMAGKLPLLVFLLAGAMILGVTLGRGTPERTLKTEPAPAAQSAVAAAGPAYIVRPVRREAPVEQHLWEQQRKSAKAEAARRNQAERQAYIHRFAGEAVDARWATAKESTILAASKGDQIVALGAQPRELDIDCRTTMCRVQADFPSESSAEDWFTLFSTTLGGEMPKVSFEFSVNPDGSARLVAYGLART